MTIMTPEQSRAARGWLGWSQAQLAKAAGVALSTVRDFEKHRRSPILNNLNAMRGALEAAGIRFPEDGISYAGQKPTDNPPNRNG
jgi:transcriptional regulator with XRE-family HTH domain